MDQSILRNLALRVRINILKATTRAGSGHPTSSLSAVELLCALFFGGILRQDTENPLDVYNDRFILSKGHAAPLLYALYEAAGCIPAEELDTLRQPDSRLQGHPTPAFRFVDVATGSLGQGLSVGVGMALGLNQLYKSSPISPHVYVLLGDSELAEGQNWEAIQLASHYKLGNLTALIDVNRLGQRGETMLGWDIQTYVDRFAVFGWNTIIVTDGNNIDEVLQAYRSIQNNIKPSVIIAKTFKGKGVSFLENKDGWHGKALTEEELQGALSELGPLVENQDGQITFPDKSRLKSPLFTKQGAFDEPSLPHFSSSVATREAYGTALAVLAENNSAIVALDAETSNSTYAEKVKKTRPEQFYEMFIAEQNMVSMALGLSKLGYIPFVSTFAAFLSRAFDQIRMAQYSKPNIKLVGSHAGVSIGQDGASQMALEDIAMMRSIRDSVVLYPSDAVSTAKLVSEMSRHTGISYLRLTREKTPIIYPPEETFPIGGLKIVRRSEKDTVVVIAAGITLHEALKAYEILKQKNIYITVVDLYSVKPLDGEGLKSVTADKKQILVVEDHYQYGGIGEAVAAAVGRSIQHLCVQSEPRSCSPDESLTKEHIAAQNIVDAVIPI